MQSSIPSLSQPTPPQRRLLTVDILRGFALLGILVVNMLYFSGPYGLVPMRESSGVDRLVEAAIRIFAEGAFYSIFSFLFGLGLSLQLDRGMRRGELPLPRFRRRLIFLVLIGLIHAYFIWYGDILVSYALAGFILSLFVFRSTGSIIAWSAGFILVTLFAYGFADTSVAIISNLEMTQAAQLLATFRDGNYASILAYRAAFVSQRWLELPFVVPSVLWLFLLGLYAGRREFLGRPSSHLQLIRRVFVFSLVVAALFKGVYAILLWSPPINNYQLTLSFVLGGPALALVYMSGLTLLVQQPIWRRLLRPLAAVGRMALSNYLLQSLVGTLIFYGYGLSLYGRYGPATTILFSLAIFLAQIIFSQLWLSRFAFGPAEWLWRSLTYGRLQSLAYRDPEPTEFIEMYADEY